MIGYPQSAKGLAFALAFASALLVAPTAASQEAEPPQLVQVRTTVVKPGMNARYEEFVMRLNSLRQEHETTQPHFMQQARTGSMAYYTVSPYQRFADLPGVNWRETFGERATEELMEMVAESVATSSLELFVNRPDLGRAPPNPAPGEYEAFWTILVKVKQNENPAYEEALAKLVEATDKVAPDLYWFAYAPGASTQHYRFVIPARWSDFDEPGLPIPERFVRAFGEAEGTKWARQLTETVEYAEQRLTRNRADLAYQP